MDVNGDPVMGATVVLTGPDPADRRTIETAANGFFEFDSLRPKVPYRIAIRAGGFAPWTSPAFTLDPGQVKLLEGIDLRIATQSTTVRVTYNPVKIATEQIKIEETQRILGVIPNFFVSYEGENAAPLTTKMKFKLAMKVYIDPITIAAAGLMAGVRQATDSLNYGQGAKGYAERFGATAADGFTEIMIGDAILPSLLHQDPRYFYQGTGTIRSRFWHAIRSPFVARGDNGKWQPNYSGVGGDLASGALSNLYYPESNRGAGVLFSNFAIEEAERLAIRVAQEFILERLTHRGGRQR